MTRGQLGDAITQGAVAIEALRRETSASTVCGTCRPLLQELVGATVIHRPMFGARTIAVGSLVAAAIALAAVVLPAWPYSPSVEAGIGIDRLWVSGTWKQVTGFSLVALSLVVAFLSVRKRIGWSWLGGYAWWRIVHALVGAAAVAVLFLHTGFNLGHNLNRWLMVTFLALAVAGGVTGIVTAREHVVLAAGRPSRRRAVTWLHILALWPLPLLLILHVGDGLRILRTGDVADGHALGAVDRSHRVGRTLRPRRHRLRRQSRVPARSAGTTAAIISLSSPAMPVTQASSAGRRCCRTPASPVTAPS